MDKFKIVVALALCFVAAYFILPIVNQAPQVESVIDPYTTRMVNDHLTIGTLIVVGIPVAIVLGKVFGK